MDLRRLDWILVKALDAHTLTDWEFKFIEDLTKRRERFGDRIKISENQERILEQISEKD